MVETASSQDSQGVQPEAFRENLRRLDRRQWWLWSSAVLVLILLTIAVASFAFPAMLTREQGTYSFYLNQSVRALVGIVLLFAVYLVYQQTMIIKMRNQLSDQVNSLTKVENLTNEVYKLAALDQLTGLYNRRSGEQRLAEEISRAVRHERPLTVLLMDLDGLKQINDRMGQPAGDWCSRASPSVYRKPFAAPTWPCGSEATSSWYFFPSAAQMKSGTLSPVSRDWKSNMATERVPCRFSRGWTDYRAGETSEELLKRADEALYANKRASKQNAQNSAKQSPVVPSVL